MLTEHARDQASSYEKQQPGNKGGYLNIPVVCGGFVAGARKRGEVTGCGILDGVPEKKSLKLWPPKIETGAGNLSEEIHESARLTLGPFADL